MLESTDTNGASYLTLDDAALLGQCEVDTYRARGPGGQKRNKTDSAVRLRHRATGLVAVSTEDRSQHVNKARALRRLRMVIALNARATLRPDEYRPSGVMATCISAAGQLCVGRRDERYPRAVAELLDLLAACGMKVRDAAVRLGVSTGNLVKFIERDPKLWRRVNELRRDAGVKPLR